MKRRTAQARRAPKTGAVTTAVVSFSQRLREAIERSGHTAAEVARRADLDASVVSRLTSKDDATRREPNLELVLALARVLQVTAAELVDGTDAAGVLAPWVARSMFDREVEARLAAERELAATRGVLAGSEREAAALRDQLGAAEQLGAEQRKHAAEQAMKLVRANAQVSQLETEVSALQASLADAKRQWADLQVRLTSAQQQLTAAQQGAARSAGLAVFGTLLGGLVGAALAGSSDDDDDLD